MLKVALQSHFFVSVMFSRLWLHGTTVQFRAMDTHSELLKEKYFANFDVSRYRNESFPNPIVIGFVASVGAGKSYLANALSKKLNVPIFTNDGIRRFLNDQGVKGSNPLPDLVIDLARARSDKLLENGISYILDADLTLTHKLDEQRMSERGAKLLLIRLNCPPELALSRIRQRADLGQSESKGNEDDYNRREKERSKVHVNEGDIFFEFNCADPFDGEVSRLVPMLMRLEV